MRIFFINRISPFQSLRRKDVILFVTLELFSIKFPNSSIGSGWYDGKMRIDNLVFVDCELNEIKQNAFVTNLNVFKRVNNLFFANTSTKSLPVNMLAPNSGLLNGFYITDFPDKHTLNDLFGQPKPKLNMKYVAVKGVESKTPRVLHPSNFSQLVSLQILELSSMEIEYIHPNTFDFTGKTLKTIDLSRNKLTTIQVRWFAVYLDTIAGAYYQLLMYQLNPLKCDCNFYELRNFTIYLKTYVLLSPHLSTSVAYRNNTCVGEELNKTCPNLQTIAKKKIFFSETVFESFSYPKVVIRVVNGRDSAVMVSTEFESKVRLIIWSHKGNEIRKRSNCPTPEWLRKSVNCLGLRAPRNVLALNEFLRQADELSFFVILTNSLKRVWPLHIATYKAIDTVEIFPDWIEVFLMLAICPVPGFLAGIWGVWLYRRRNCNQPSAQMDRTEAW